MSEQVNYGKRWYDKDPILKEALELLKLSSDEQKEQAKDFMLKLQEDVAADALPRLSGSMPHAVAIRARGTSIAVLHMLKL